MPLFISLSFYMKEAKMSEIIMSRKQEKPYTTDRYKRQPVATEGGDDFGTTKQEEYFERVSLLQYFVILFGLVSFGILSFQTNLCPFEKLGDIGRRLEFLTSNHLGKMRILFIFTVIVHLFEAVYAHYQCRKARKSDSCRQKWMIQTFIIGYGSLRLLNEYCDKKATKKFH